MKIVMRIVVVALCLVAAVAAQAPNLVGQWQGTLVSPGAQLRLVIVIAASGQGNTLTATTYSIDQPGGGRAATVAVQGGNVRITVAPLNASFEGKLSADGNSLAGTFTQGVTLPLTLERANKDTRGRCRRHRGQWQRTRLSPSRWQRSSPIIRATLERASP